MADGMNPRRGQIWDVNLDPTEGSEIGGHRAGETRPVIVVSVKGKGRPSMRVCVPLTDFKNEHAYLRYCALFTPDNNNGLTKPSTADTSQIRALDLVRFVKQRGRLDKSELTPLFAALGACLGFQVVAEDDVTSPS